MGIRMYSKVGEVIFSTDSIIENVSFRKIYQKDYTLQLFEIDPGERIIGIQSFDDGFGLN